MIDVAAMVTDVDHRALEPQAALASDAPSDSSAWEQVL
jgi:hypothetical protein